MAAQSQTQILIHGHANTICIVPVHVCVQGSCGKVGPGNEGLVPAGARRAMQESWPQSPMSPKNPKFQEVCPNFFLIYFIFGCARSSLLHAGFL